ncbi:glycosyltransferase family 4 protein [Acidiphilium sp. PA]|uniref:glycosyltransferase family 4 protein n=1 Tax=Acidiphilium sp. PA TaxID=2871705 RepID=UPI002244C3B5|nr:glycosyltransferase family 4 protein [Acidiphilium sp. PA]MCW8309394.1 glycosyltransferase family 4 protein [Acidiphilium sp. PA]
MEKNPIKVLFTHYGDPWFRGSEQILLDLMTNLDPARIQPILWCNGKLMEDAGRRAGITTYRTDFEYYFDYSSPRFSPRRYLSFVREGISLVRRHDVKVIHANSAAPNQWLLPVARTTRRPLLAHLHIDYLRRGRYVCLLHQSTLVVGVSRQVITNFLTDGMPVSRTHVIYNGIDTSRLRSSGAPALRQVLGLPEDAIVLSTAGSLISRKGHDVLIRATSMLDPGSEVHLLIVGDGPERETLERLAAEIGLQARVHFLGYRPDMPLIYEATDVFVLASRKDATPLVLVEAGYFSIPSVATTVGGISEVITDGKTGLLVPPNDPPALAAALQKLIADRSYRKELGQNARARTEQMFLVDQMVNCFQQTYEKLSALPETKTGWAETTKNLRVYLPSIKQKSRNRRDDAVQ